MSDSGVLELEEGGPAVRAVAPLRSEDALPKAPRRELSRRKLPLKPLVKRIVLGLTLVVLILAIESRLVAPLLFQQRQQHLSAQLSRPLPTVESGDALGIVQIPLLGVNDVIIEGVDVDHLRSGPAHLAGSALPGDAGLMVIVGHRDAYGGPFEKISKLKKGDSFVVQARNSGPIVRYIVDRVERRSSLGAVELEKTDQIAYALLVTGEDGFLTNGQAIVVGRALPVTTAAPVVPDLSHGLEQRVPFGVEALLAFGSAATALLAMRFLRHRASRTVGIVVVAPVATYATIQLIMLLDSVLPVLR